MSEQSGNDTHHEELVIGIYAAASILDVTPGYIGHLIKAGALPVYENLHSKMLTGRYVFLRADLERILQTRDPITGKFNHQGSVSDRTVKLQQAADILDLPLDEIFFLMDNKTLKFTTGVARSDKAHPDFYIDTQSVLDLKTRRDAIEVQSLLQKPLLDKGEVCQVLQRSQKVIERLIDEKRLQCLNIMPKASYKVWRVTSSSIKVYMSEQEKAVVTLEKAGELLGITRERVRQLIQEGKLEARNVSRTSENARWEISRESIEARLQKKARWTPSTKQEAS